MTKIKHKDKIFAAGDSWDMPYVNEFFIYEDQPEYKKSTDNQTGFRLF